MSTRPPFPIADDLRRFVLTSIPSVSYLEAMLLFSRAPHSALGAGDVARLLYLPERNTVPLLRDLCDAGVLRADDADPRIYHFAPRDAALASMIERLARAYEADLIGITKLIHDRTQKSAQRFSEAFKWRKDS